MFRRRGAVLRDFEIKGKPIQYNTSTIQYNTIQYKTSTIQYNTNTIQYKYNTKQFQHTNLVLACWDYIPLIWKSPCGLQVNAETCRRLMFYVNFILLCAHVWYSNCKNTHGMNNITLEGSWLNSRRGKSFFSTPSCPDRPWGQDSLLFSVQQVLFSQG